MDQLKASLCSNIKKQDDSKLIEYVRTMVLSGFWDQLESRLTALYLENPYLSRVVMSSDNLAVLLIYLNVGMRR